MAESIAIIGQMCMTFPLQLPHKKADLRKKKEINFVKGKKSLDYVDNILTKSKNIFANKTAQKLSMENDWR